LLVPVADVMVLVQLAAVAAQPDKAILPPVMAVVVELKVLEALLEFPVQELEVLDLHYLVVLVTQLQVVVAVVDIMVVAAAEDQVVLVIMVLVVVDLDIQIQPIFLLQY
jgi:hypothetical protein